jgi:1,4-alpha-glucan branching enzyme
MVFNFNTTRSFTDYGIPLKGKFKVVLDSDDPEFGGFDRINRTSYYTSTRKAERPTLDQPFYLYLYLPSRTALVFKKETVRRATDI